MVQWKDLLGQGFFFSSFGLAFVCHSLSSWASVEASLDEAAAAAEVPMALGEEGSENYDVEPSGAAPGEALESNPGESSAFEVAGDSDAEEAWYQPGFWSQESEEPGDEAPEVLGHLWSKVLGS